MPSFNTYFQNDQMIIRGPDIPNAMHTIIIHKQLGLLLGPYRIYWSRTKRIRLQLIIAPIKIVRGHVAKFARDDDVRLPRYYPCELFVVSWNAYTERGGKAKVEKVTEFGVMFDSERMSYDPCKLIYRPKLQNLIKP
jgi:hypothetical protein